MNLRSSTGYHESKIFREKNFLGLTHNKVYEVVYIEKEWYRIVDDSRDDYLYPPECFEIVEKNDGSVPVLDYSPPEEERERRMLEMGVKDGSGNLIYE